MRIFMRIFFLIFSVVAPPYVKGTNSDPLGPRRALASPAILVVDDDGQATPSNCDATASAFSTIQSAITAAASGDTILVCPGTYQEELFIDKSLTLRGIGSPVPVIEAPATLTTRTLEPGRTLQAIIFVTGPVTVTIERFLIDGRGVGNTNTRLTGITYFQASGAIRNCEIKRVRGTPLGTTAGGQYGLPIVVTHEFDTVVPHDVAIESNLIHDYEKTGIVCNELGAVCHIVGNTVIGSGPTSVTGQNGISVGFGARAEVIGNVITDNFFTGPGADAAGILLFGVGHNPFTNSILGPTLVKGNTVTENEVGIAIAGGAFGFPYFSKSVSVLENDISGNNVGIAVYEDNVAQNVAHFNNIEGNTGFGVWNEDPNESFDAIHNWWGDPSGPFHAVLNPSGGGDSVSDNVDFTPWLGIEVTPQAQFFGDQTARTVGVNLTTRDFGIVVTGSTLICSGTGVVRRSAGGFSASGRCREDPRDSVGINVRRGFALVIWLDREGPGRGRTIIRRFAVPSLPRR